MGRTSPDPIHLTPSPTSSIWASPSFCDSVLHQDMESHRNLQSCLYLPGLDSVQRPRSLVFQVQDSALKLQGPGVSNCSISFQVFTRSPAFCLRSRMQRLSPWNEQTLVKLASHQLPPFPTTPQCTQSHRDTRVHTYHAKENPLVGSPEMPRGLNGRQGKEGNGRISVYVSLKYIHFCFVSYNIAD